jgi:hypothetical protein
MWKSLKEWFTGDEKAYAWMVAIGAFIFACWMLFAFLDWL